MHNNESYGAGGCDKSSMTGIIVNHVVELILQSLILRWGHHVTPVRRRLEKRIECGSCIVMHRQVRRASLLLLVGLRVIHLETLVVGLRVLGLGLLVLVVLLELHLHLHLLLLLRSSFRHLVPRVPDPKWRRSVQVLRLGRMYR